MSKSWLNWKTFVLVAVGLVVAGPLIRGLVSVVKFPNIVAERGTPAPIESQNPSAPAAVPTAGRSSAKTVRGATIDLNGQSIPTSGQPTILLNPGMVRPGTKVAVSGFGFDPGASIDILLKKDSLDAGTSLSLAKTDETGSFAVSFTVPEQMASRSPIVQAHERNSSKVAQTKALMPAGMAIVKLGKATAKPGDTISISATGFEPEEDVKVYWGQLNGDPAATLHADGGGNVGHASVQIPVGATGNTSVVLVGSKSQSLAIGQFYMLGLYPSVKVQPYAVKSANRINLSGAGFGPGETVLVYVNGISGPPLLTVPTDGRGNFSGIGFTVPFGLRAQQSLILIGEQSRAQVNSGFLVLPYTPSLQPSTYGGSAGTTLSFYATGYAPNEVVLVYKGRTKSGGGELISAFRVDGRGRAAAAGQYMIPAGDQGKVAFTGVGRKSGGLAVATVTVDHSEVPVQLAPQPKYSLPPELQETPAPSGAPGNPPGGTQGQQLTPPSSHTPGANGRTTTPGTRGAKNATPIPVQTQNQAPTPAVAAPAPPTPATDQGTPAPTGNDQGTPAPAGNDQGTPTPATDQGTPATPDNGGQNPPGNDQQQPQQQTPDQTPPTPGG